ncbi:MAG: aminoglycoside resistance protein [Mycobacterium sp.]|nr:aminoglycoside resistance protein [Mycobacterium sp.]
MAARGAQWAVWVEELPKTVQALMVQWQLHLDGTATNGHCSLVLPVRTPDGTAAMLKVGFPEEDSEHEHLALRRWGGAGAVRLLSADPHRRGLLLERLHHDDLTTVPDEEACRVVAGLYRRVHVAALPRLRSLSSCLEGWNAELAGLPRNAPIPRRLIEQAIALGGDLVVDRTVPDRLLHTDLHYANVLAGDREAWLVIDPKPLNGDPHYEIAPMLWNRWDEIARDVRSGVRRRFWQLVDAAELDEDRARAWVLVRMVHNAMWELRESRPDPVWLTRCVAVAKAVQD